MAQYFGLSKGEETQTSAQLAGKLSNGIALTVSELSKEPTTGLLHVAGHIQQSVPGLLQSKEELLQAHTQLKALLHELQDVQAGVRALVGPVAQRKVSSLAASAARLQGLAADGSGGGGGGSGSGSGTEGTAAQRASSPFYSNLVPGYKLW